MPIMVLWHLDFYFNFTDSIWGQLESRTMSDGTSTILPHTYFLATRLLPCGMFDKHLKFTGSDNIAPAMNPITKAIHAFAHFSYVYSKGFLVFSDLQGIYDNSGQMCLIDPQVHTYVLTTSLLTLGCLRLHLATRNSRIAMHTGMVACRKSRSSWINTSRTVNRTKYAMRFAYIPWLSMTAPLALQPWTHQIFSTKTNEESTISSIRVYQ